MLQHFAFGILTHFTKKVNRKSNIHL